MSRPLPCSCAGSAACFFINVLPPDSGYTYTKTYSCGISHSFGIWGTPFRRQDSVHCFIAGSSTMCLLCCNITQRPLHLDSFLDPQEHKQHHPATGGFCFGSTANNMSESVHARITARSIFINCSARSLLRGWP
jgi:hypothetical protein